MYINKIDDIIDKVIDDFYNSVFTNEKNDKLLSEINFVKYQKEINNILLSYNKSINVTQIKEIVQNEDNVITILEIIKRYIAYYFFLYLGVFYVGKKDNYINNIIEFSKNQIGFNYKIQNFFNSENNSILISYYEMIYNIYSLLNADKTALSKLVNKAEIKNSVDFLNSLGQEFVETNFKLDNLNNNKKDQAHNIVKTVTLLELYKKNEKIEVFKILESSGKEEGEYIFIDIVVPKKRYIDFSAVENILTKREIVQNLANEFWNYIIENEEGPAIQHESIEERILLLINSGIIVPIVDDFLLYHKDTEKYDKNIDITQIKKKEDTKIKYIINKIDNTTNYYSESIKNDPKMKENIKKNFFPPLIDRKAILMNNNEDLKIISKFMNLGRKSIENLDYYNDLMNYRSYSYTNFKDFEKDGFSMLLDKTINLVRFVSLEKTGDFKQNDKNPLQLRVGSEGQIINIIGFCIPTNKKNINCLKVRDLQNIKNFGNNKNGYNLLVNYLQKSSIEGKEHNSSVYWLFDLNEDNIKMDTYEQSTKMTTQEQIKLIINKLYYDIINEIYYKIVNILDKKENIEIQKGYSIIKKVENRLLTIPRNSEIYNDLENYIIFEKSLKIIPKYDEKEDIFYGLTGDIIKLPSVPKPKEPPIQTITIDTRQINTEKEIIENEQVEGVCQHNITWEHISSLRQKNPGKYTDLLYEFIQQYVIENNDQDYICKSCGTLLNIKKYIIDGEFDGDSQKFVTYSMPMEVPLEDIPEYEKFRGSIRNMDKLTERIAIISNIQYFIGTTLSVKWRRKAIIKDAIDIILLNNKILKKNFKERNELASKQYGISRDLSNLFVFDLDNEIFKFSSKEKDYYKPIKQNNVLTYIIILLLLEINESQLTFMTGDKKGICNFPVFEKYGHVLFDGLKIRKNKDGDLDNLKNYRVLCYILYIISCMITKYNIWFFDSDETKKKKFNPIIQKSIIHTIVDLLNSIIENSVIKNVHHIYEIITTRFFKKLTSMFNNDTLIEKFKSEYDKTSVVSDKKTYILSKYEPIILKGRLEQQTFDDPKYLFCRLPKYYIPKRTIKYHDYYHINNITNCPQGTFHSWKTKGTQFICEICGTNLESLTLNEKQSNEILVNFKYSRLQKLAHKYCLTGSVHTYLFNKETKTSVCTKCNKDENYVYSKKELDELKQNLEKNKLKHISQNITSFKKNDELIEKNKEYKEKVFNKLNEKYKKYSDKDNMYKYIDLLIDDIQSSIGSEKGTKDNLYLKDNSYSIDHDHLGYSYDKPIIVTDKDNFIKYKSNHPFYKTDVIYYTNTKNGRIDVFYDATTLILIGYKETSKDFVLNLMPDRKLKVNYSIYNKLKIMGYETRFINVKEKIDDIIDMYIGDVKDNKLVFTQDDAIKELFKELVRTRIFNLKKVIYEFQRFLYRIKNGYVTEIKKKEKTEENEDKEDEEEYNFIEIVTNKYYKKLVNMNLYDNSKEHKVFKHWKAIATQIFTDVTDVDINISIDTKIIDSEIINNYDYNGNLLLFYIVSEMTKLLKYNQNKIIKTNMIDFFIEFINIMFDMFNVESKLNNHDIKRFIMSLRSSIYIQDLENIITGHTEGIYQEYKDVDDKESEETNEEEEDAREEADALDIDNELEFGDDLGDRFDYGSQYDLTYADYEEKPENTFWEPIIPNPYD